MTNNLYLKLEAKINSLPVIFIENDRQEILLQLASIIQEKLNKGEDVNLNFICTHNSRRSQISQIWAAAIVLHFGFDNIRCYSGGTEITAFHPNAIKALEKNGFVFQSESNSSNPHYFVSFSDLLVPLNCFSKVFDDEQNDAKPFVAIITCSDAEANCPFIPDAEKRIAIRYKDPKYADNTPEKEYAYDLCSDTIASEMHFVFSSLKNEMDQQFL